MNEGGFQLFWCGESNYQIIFTSGWWDNLKQYLISVFHNWTMKLSLLWSCLEISFWCVGAYELLKEVISIGLVMVNPISISFLLLVEWKIFKQLIISVLVTWTMILSLLYSYLEISFWCVTDMNEWKRVVSNCFDMVDMVNPVIKSFLLLVDGKIFTQYLISVFHNWIMMLSLM